MPLTDTLPILEIPVVVHIIHRGSPVGVAENISDAQIFSAIEALNEDFRKIPGSNGDGLGVDTRIEFSLAKRTPQGTPSSGIVRVDGSSIPEFFDHGIASTNGLPGADEETVKAFTSWYGNDYLNVFVVPEINGNNGGGGIQGFAYTGPTADVRDGVTVLYNAFGTVGTLKPGRTLNRTLTHEVGHHLSLFHTFHETSNCNEEADCTLSGDRVCDTPVTTENNSCSQGLCPAAQRENYLDYTPTSCRNTFTAGQSSRMRECLETVRLSLLESLGATPVVDFDLIPIGVDESELCQQTWRPVLSVQNQGAAASEGAVIHWSVDGIPLTPVVHADPIPPGTTTSILMPEMLVINPTTTWTFRVAMPDLLNDNMMGIPDDYNDNDTLIQTVELTGDDRWKLTLNTDFYGNETSWAVLDSNEIPIWSGGVYAYGANTYVEEACIPVGCYQLVVHDSGDNGLSLGGSLMLQNASGDTLAMMPTGTNFGSSIQYEACAVSPPWYDEIVSNSVCPDFNLNGMCDEDEIVGCTYPSAPNFNPEASLDDGSCEVLCLGDLDGDGAVQSSDLLAFLALFGLSCN